MRHVNATKIGPRPSHPVGHHPISARLARNMRHRYRPAFGTSKVHFQEGDLLCKVCFSRESARIDPMRSAQTETMDVGEDSAQIDQADDSRDTIDVSMNWDDNEDDTPDGSDDSQESFRAPGEESKASKQTLNGIFELLGIAPITDV
jgi:hypothetical protein